MTVEPQKQAEPTPFDTGKEMRQQTELLKSINGKLGFFVLALVISVIFQIFGALLSF